MFYVGQKVACKDGSKMLGIIKTGDVFHISGVYDFIFGYGLNFSDGPLPPSEFKHWNARYFEPVVEHKTDISVFTALLNPAHQTENV